MHNQNNRRKFIKQTSAAAAGISMFPTLSWAESVNLKEKGANEILEKLSVLNDDLVSTLLKDQRTIPGDRWDGGVVNRFDLLNEHSTAWFIVRLGSSYISEYSAYYKSEALEKPIEAALTCLLNVQHEDGTIDLYSTNFHSTPDTAFLVNYLSPVYVCLKRLRQSSMKGVVSNLERFFKNAGECLIVGGIHTPNHRWVVSSALARLNDFFPDKRYIDRMEEWLGEGIDMDPDGQYTEQSVSIYSPVCNNMFLTIGRLLDRPELLENVRKNLIMSLYYIQPDGEVLTDASNRQDNARTGYINQYYYAYRYFAIKDGNPAFAAVCQLIEQQMPDRISRFLPLLLEDKIFDKKVPKASKVPDNYFKRFEHSGVFRIRRGDTDISIIEQNPTFLSFRKGEAVMQSMRLASAFFGKGQFLAEETDFDGKVITMKRTLTKGYYQPPTAEQRTGENDWENIPRSTRQLSEAQTQNWQVQISEENGKATIEIEITGTAYVPVSLEMSFREGGEFSGVTPDNSLDNSYFLESGVGQYKVGKDVINFGSGAAAHKWAEMRGMLPKQKGNSVYITGHTPFKHVVELS
ncbi:MAG: hypothetical protein ACJA2S_004409 [Cyclobacteriaceae bacterium]|jgi:hypothetical protein